jgi:peptidoglycan hydrolase CwlO-like protein
MTVEVALLIAVVGCFVGLAGWLSSRDKKISEDGKWKGSVDAKLDNIQSGVTGLNDRMSKMEGAISSHETRITVIENQIGIGKEKPT